MPSTKHIESRILDFPLPFKPVIALNDGSKSRIIVRLPYDLKPSIDRVFMNILSNHIKTTTQPAIQIKKHSCCCFSILTFARSAAVGWIMVRELFCVDGTENRVENYMLRGCSCTVNQANFRSRFLCCLM